MGTSFADKDQAKKEYDSFARRASAPEGKILEMPEEIQDEMEGIFGYDFSDVTLREKPEAEELGDEAYAVGNEIHFAPGRFKPHTKEGKKLLIHELTHVVQHAEGRAETAGGFATGDAAVQEAEAEAMEERSLSGVRRTENAKDGGGHVGIRGPRISGSQGLKSLGAAGGNTLLGKSFKEWIKNAGLRIASFFSRQYRQRDQTMERRETFQETREQYENTIKKTGKSEEFGKGHTFGQYQRADSDASPEIDGDTYLKDPLKEEIRTDPALKDLVSALPGTPPTGLVQVFKEAVDAINMYTDIPNIVNPETVKMEVAALNQIRRKTQQYHVNHEYFGETLAAKKERGEETGEELEEFETSVQRDGALRQLWAKLETKLGGSLDLVTEVDAAAEADVSVQAYLDGMDEQIGEYARRQEHIEADPNEAMFHDISVGILAFRENEAEIDEKTMEDNTKSLIDAIETYLKLTFQTVGAEPLALVNYDWAKRADFLEHVLAKLKSSPMAAKIYLQEAAEGKTYVDTEASASSPNRSNMASTPLFLHTPCLNDIRQNTFRDCFLMSATQSLVQINPEYIYSMFHDLGNGDVVVRLYRVLLSEETMDYLCIPNYIKIRKQFDTGNVYNGGAPWVQMLEKAYAINLQSSNLDKLREEDAQMAPLELKEKGDEIEFYGVQRQFSEGGSGPEAIWCLTGKAVEDVPELTKANRVPQRIRTQEFREIVTAISGGEYGPYLRKKAEDPLDQEFLDIAARLRKFGQEMDKIVSESEIVRAKNRFLWDLVAMGQKYAEGCERQNTDQEDGDEAKQQQKAVQEARIRLLRRLQQDLAGAEVIRLTKEQEAAARRESPEAAAMVEEIRNQLAAKGALMLGRGPHYYTIVDMKEVEGKIFFLIRDPFNVERTSYKKEKDGTVSRSDTGYGSVVGAWLGSDKSKGTVSADWNQMMDKQLQGMSWWDLDTLLAEDGQCLHKIRPVNGEVLKAERAGVLAPATLAEEEQRAEDPGETLEERTARATQKEQALKNAVSAKEAKAALNLMDYTEKGTSLKARVTRIRYDERLDQDAKIRQVGILIMGEMKRKLKEKPAVTKAFMEEYRYIAQACARHMGVLKSKEKELSNLILSSHAFATEILNRQNVRLREQGQRALGNDEGAEIFDQVQKEFEALSGRELERLLGSRGLQGNPGKKARELKRDIEAYREVADPMMKQFHELSIQAEAGSARRNKDNAQLLRSILEQIRELGPADPAAMGRHLTPSTVGAEPTAGVDKVIAEAYNYYPREWVEASMKKSTMETRSVERGDYNDRTNVMRISGSNHDSHFRVALHELGHRMEHVIGEIRLQERGFYQRRAAGAPEEWLGEPYNERERAKFGDFLIPYMGKGYSTNAAGIAGNTDAYELMSMGAEMAFTDPAKLMLDEDMAVWIFGMLGFL